MFSIVGGWLSCSQRSLDNEAVFYYVSVICLPFGVVAHCFCINILKWNNGLTLNLQKQLLLLTAVQIIWSGCPVADLPEAYQD